ncbi:hypothetical protein LTR02_014072 [Friedmanniomyces endolithicus]|nr:hypothetical protein LTR94_016781 [Friedmanniomyces endolithicus]KAK0776128.1 hypothetical protein LTR38_015614 [Friedmanniomyces endolithicus]KAK0776980.1 hypothetical protein LTR59_014009 [Friedmanniomyces endolithicus]KAK0787311.1 hypothetical protein LTR75_012937 [Friedmanniomyces endolithicus]KAK0831772.1 hypothetical protein LTR03_015478 [Friedmanniomyces endolithicus]
MPPQLISGDIGAKPVDELRTTLQAVGIGRIDNAARYGGRESERIIGAAHIPEDFTVDTKVYFTFVPLGGGMLSATAIEDSVSNSLKSLGVEKFNVLYCHGPDYVTPLSETAKAFDEQFQKGRFTHLGVSNFEVPMLKDWFEIAEREGYVLPSAFQGQYNLLCRQYETELFPLLREKGMAFNAYSPLAGGFLLGHLMEQGHQSGTTRFKDAAGMYNNFYDKPSMHEAIKKLREVGQQAGVGIDELSLRCLRYHSILQDQDGIILGSSKVAQIERNCEQLAKGPLGESVAKELSALYGGVRADAKLIVDFSPEGYFYKAMERK